MRAVLTSVAICAGLLGLIAPARADRIDGAWCHDQGARMMIDGPAIVTPTGTHTQGDYSRHAFSYVVPPEDPGAGTIVRMRLLNEETVQVQAGPQAPWETWNRCGPSISLLERIQLTGLS